MRDFERMWSWPVGASLACGWQKCRSFTDFGSTRLALRLLAIPQCAMLMVVDHQAKQERKCESLAVLELTEATNKAEPPQTAILQDMEDSPSRSVTKSGRDDEDHPTASVRLHGHAQGSGVLRQA